jgi:DnaK suppressor protein
LAIEKEKLRNELLAEEKKLKDSLASEPPKIGDYEEYEIQEVRDKYFLDKERNRGRLRVVTSALERFERGVFGECLDCHGPIEEERLESDPTRERCSSCQSKLSLPQKTASHWPHSPRKPAPENIRFRV